MVVAIVGYPLLQSCGNGHVLFIRFSGTFHWVTIQRVFVTFCVCRNVTFHYKAVLRQRVL